MTSQSTLKLNELLSPISKKMPVGINIREDAELLKTYHKIKEARSAARLIERQKGITEWKSAIAEWHKVYEIALNILAKHSKDLEIASWLSEALLRKSGFAGLNQGFKLIRELCQHYWEQLYPLPDEDGIISRIAPLIGLNGEDVDGSLIIPIALVPLTEAKKSEPYALWQYQQALELLKISDPEKKAQRIASGSISLEMIELALRKSSAAFLLEKQQSLKACIEEYQQLILFLEEKCGTDAPPSSRILNHLHACLDCLSCVKNSEPNTEIFIDPAIQNTALTEIKAAPNLARETVLDTLLQAAAFFKKHEPHSPLPYILERAVRWANMPFAELLKEMVQDEDTRKQVKSLTGVEF